MSWSEARLADCVLEMRSGASIHSGDFIDVGFPVLHKGSIKEGGRVVVDRGGKSHVATEYADQKPKAIVDSRFVVATLRNLVRSGETLGYMAPVPSGSKYILAQGAYGLLLDESKLDKRYLAYLSNAHVFHKEVLKRMVGSTQVHIRNSQFLDIPVPLPPLEEQKRIAKILDAADALRAKRRESLAQLDALLQSTFLALFGDPSGNPHSWKICKMVDVCEKITDGTHHSPPIVEEGVPYVTAKHIKAGGVKFFENPWYVSQEEHAKIYSRCDPVRGDVLYIKDGATTGVAAINCFDFEFSMLSSVALIRPNRNVVLPEYVCAYLNNEKSKKRFLGDMGGAAIKRLTLAKIKRFDIPVPDMEVQRKFSEVVFRIQEQSQKLRAQLDCMDELFGSLQQRAFSGEL